MKKLTFGAHPLAICEAWQSIPSREPREDAGVVLTDTFTFLSYSALRPYIRPTIETTLPKIVACIRAARMDTGVEILLNLTSNKHDKDGEKPFEPRVAGDIAKANSGERGGGEVEGGDVGVHLGCHRYHHHHHHRRRHDHHHDHDAVGFHLGNLQAAVQPIFCSKL